MYINRNFVIFSHWKEFLSSRQNNLNNYSTTSVHCTIQQVFTSQLPIKGNNWRRRRTNQQVSLFLQESTTVKRRESEFSSTGHCPNLCEHSTTKRVIVCSVTLSVNTWTTSTTTSRINECQLLLRWKSSWAEPVQWYRQPARALFPWSSWLQPSLLKPWLNRQQEVGTLHCYQLIITLLLQLCQGIS